MDDRDEPFVTPSQPYRREGQLELRAWATPAELDRGLEAALEVFLARCVPPGRAAVCSQAVSAFEADHSLPEPDAETRAAAAAFEEASDAAILAAGAMLNQDNELSVGQGPEDRALWDELPTLRAWRAKHAPPGADHDATDGGPVNRGG